MEAHSDEVSRCAYRIWENAGRPHGRDLEHWLQAERELSVADDTAPTSQQSTSATGTAPRKRSSPSRSRTRRVTS
jgi:hypothetical protein